MIAEERITSSEKALLFIHGIFGSYRYFSFLKERIPESVSYCFLELKGHDQSVKEFSHVRIQDWEEEVEEEVLRLIRMKKKIIIVAHSMGTLFGVEEAISHKEVEFLFLLNPPFRWTFKLKNVLPYLQLILDSRHKCQMAEDMKKASDLQLTKNLFFYVHLLPVLVQLKNLIKKTRKDLPQLKTNGICFLSCHDQLVGKKTKELVQKYPVLTLADIDSSNHFFYSQEDKKKISAEFDKLF